MIYIFLFVILVLNILGMVSMASQIEKGKDEIMVKIDELGEEKDG